MAVKHFIHMVSYQILLLAQSETVCKGRRRQIREGFGKEAMNNHAVSIGFYTLHMLVAEMGPLMA